MKKIFYTDKTAYPDSQTAIKHVLSEYFNLKAVKIVKNEHGKPYLENGRDIPLFFSVSHTENRLFIAVSDENVGIDAENPARQVDYLPVIKRFSPEERREIFYGIGSQKKAQSNGSAVHSPTIYINYASATLGFITAKSKSPLISFSVHLKDTYSRYAANAISTMRNLFLFHYSIFP